MRECSGRGWRALGLLDHLINRGPQSGVESIAQAARTCRLLWRAHVEEAHYPRHDGDAVSALRAYASSAVDARLQRLGVHAHDPVPVVGRVVHLLWGEFPACP